MERESVDINGEKIVFFVQRKNIKNMIGKFSTILGDNEINITDMINKSKGEIAYSMLDLEAPVTEEIVKALQAVEGVFRVRVVK